MESIRDYAGPISLCGTCGQPAHRSEEGMDQHFSEQWDGVFCPRFPLAGKLVAIEWDGRSLDAVKRTYSDTYPHWVPGAAV